MFTFFRSHYYAKYHDKYQHAKKLFAFDIALLALAATMMSVSVFLFFWKPSLVGLIDLSLSLGDARIKSGNNVHLIITYTNKSKYLLTNTSLAVRLPTGFIIDRSKTPKDTFSDQGIVTTLKELPAGASGHADIYGTLWTDSRMESQIIATLSYKPENKKTPEQKLASFVTTITESVLTSTLSFPDTAFAGSKTPFTLTIKNTDNQTVNNIFFTNKNGWDIHFSDPNDSLPFALASGQTKTIRGDITAPNKEGSYTFEISPTISINNINLHQNTAQTKNFTIISPQLPSHISITHPPAYIEPGQIIPAEITWENKSSAKLRNLTLHITSNIAGIIDWKKTAAENHARVENNGIFFDDTSRTKLNNGSQNNNETFTIKIYLLSHFNLPQSENQILSIFPFMQAAATTDTQQTFAQNGTGIQIPIATEIDFSNIEARYYTNDGDQLGRGPLPPKVGKTTKYWILLKVNNTSNAIENVHIQTKLPRNIEFTGKQSTTIGPALTYNSVDRSITWTYYALPANSQTGLYFEVSATPSTADIGKSIQLTDAFSLSAVDSYTKKSFNLSHTPIYNSLNKNDAGSQLGSRVTP